MLEQALTALAAAGGSAVVQAAGTDAWAGLRQGVALWSGRGDERRERAELERLDRTAGELEAAEPTEAEQARIRQEAAWTARIEALLENLENTQRAQAADELRTLLTQHSPQGDTVSATQGGLVASGDLNIHAEKGSIAAGVINGGAHIGPPPQPGPHQS